MAEGGVPVVGGHSVDDAEPKFGYTVIGEVHPDRMVGHDGARAGDILFLTKPLGTALVTTAIKRGLCPPELEREAILEVSDDGPGFDVDKAASGGGLQHMRDRIVLLGGRLSIDSKRGAGTVVAGVIHS